MRDGYGNFHVSTLITAVHWSGIVSTFWGGRRYPDDEKMYETKKLPLSLSLDFDKCITIAWLVKAISNSLPYLRSGKKVLPFARRNRLLLYILPNHDLDFFQKCGGDLQLVFLQLSPPAAVQRVSSRVGFNFYTSCCLSVLHLSVPCSSATNQSTNVLR
jgi:hypothetical protein